MNVPYLHYDTCINLAYTPPPSFEALFHTFNDRYIYFETVKQKLLWNDIKNKGKKTLKHHCFGAGLSPTTPNNNERYACYMLLIV